MNERGLYKALWEHHCADKAMVLLAGPRQCGKTTFAKDIVAKAYRDVEYFNWDQNQDKQRLIADPLFFTKAPRSDAASRPLIILDEIHKYRHWKNYLKGVYDQCYKDYQFLVTGSGRLEFSRKAGDSLAGRFLRFHFFPLTLAELSSHRHSWNDFIKDPLMGIDHKFDTQSQAAFESLMEFSGFPEPFFKARKTFWRAWSAGYGQQIVRDDLRSVADLRNLDTIELLYALLPTRVGSPLSMNNLAGDLQVSFDTVKSWLLLFDLFYLTFRISPWSDKITRGLHKEKKIYIFNYPLIEDEGLRFENLVAVELLRGIENWNDYGFGNFNLHYVRNKEKQEVDFILSNNNRPILLIETKTSEDEPTKPLKLFQTALNVPAVQLVNKDKIHKVFRNGKHNILVVTAHQWLSNLP